MKPSPSSSSSGYANAALVAIVAITIVCYLPALQAGFINYDDFDYVTKNPYVPGGVTMDGVTWAFTTNFMANWHPLAWISHMIDASIFGLNPTGHHATSVALHALNAVLLGRLLINTTQKTWPSIIVAALFALHPLHVESVAWVSERKDVLCGTFWLLTLLAWVRFTRASSSSSSSSSTNERKRSTYYYALALLMFALALASKPMAVTLPFVLLLLDVWPLARKKSRRSIILVEKLPFFALSIASSIATYAVQKSGGAMEVVKPLSLGYRVSNALVSYVRYVGKTLLPIDLAIIYPHPGGGGGGGGESAAWSTFAIAFAVISLAVLTFIALRTRWLPMWCLFLGVLVPTIGLVQVGAQSMADRYMYLPIIGLLVPLVWGVDSIVKSAVASTILPLATIAICAALTSRQAAFFKDGVSVFEHAVQVTAPNVVGETQLGSALVKANRPDDAERAYRRAVAIDPSNVLAHTYLGSLLTRRGMLAEAVREHEAAIQSDPKAAIAHYNLGLTLLKMKRLPRATTEFEDAVVLAPMQPETHTGLGIALSNAGRLVDAERELQTAIRLNPNSTLDARDELGIVYMQTGRAADGLRKFQEVVAIDPSRSTSRANLGNALVDTGQLDAGIRELEAASRLDPNNALTRYALAGALLQRGRRGEAIMQYQESLRLDPSNEDAKRELAGALGN